MFQQAKTHLLTRQLHAFNTWIWYLKYACSGPLCQKHKQIEFVGVRILNNRRKTKINNVGATQSTKHNKLYLQLQNPDVSIIL